MIEGKAYRALSLLDEEAVPVIGGALQWVPVRRRLGVRAFGTNAYRAARAGDEVVEDHDESGGHEEVYLVVRGAARFEVGEEVVEVPAGTMVFLPEPDVRRHAVATEDETVVLAVGGWPDRAFEPSPWEPVFLAHEALEAQDWARAAEILEREAAREQRQSAAVRFHLARCLVRLGDRDRAAQELRAAAERDGDRARAWAAQDPELEALL